MLPEPLANVPREAEVDTVLQVRLESIRTNLEQVASAKDFVAGRRSDIHSLTSVFERDEGFRGAIREGIKMRLAYARNLATTIKPQGETQTTNLRQLIENLQVAIDEVERIDQQAETTARIALTMGTRWSPFAGESFDRHIDQSFRTEARTLIDEIDTIDHQNPEQAWKTYREKVRDQSDALFSEYVEFLGGLALRDTGLGGLLPSAAEKGDEDPADTNDEAEYNRDVCVMADELIRQISYFREKDLWHSMAVPGRTWPTARTLSRMIRLGFPDWTVWVVPLAAFQFGLVVVDENHLVERYPEPAGVSNAELRVVLADAFATFTAGPSYALASILTKLEPKPETVPGDPHEGSAETVPGEPHEGSPETVPGEPHEASPESQGLTDNERVSMILATLAFMDEESILEDLIQSLHGRWEAAMQHSGGETDPSPDAGARVTAWSTYMHEFLDSQGTQVRYGARRWRAAMKWPPFTEQGAAESVSRQVPWEQQTVRDILNAAWYQRITSQQNSRDIAIAALNLWRRNTTPRPATTNPTSRGV